MIHEVEHLISVLEGVKQALETKDSAKLKELSNQTIHSASVDQGTDTISIAVIVYSLSKILERKDIMKIKNYDQFERKIKDYLTLAITSLMEKNFNIYIKYLQMIRTTISSISVNLKPYIQEVVRKASINKASKIYEHGISMGQTAQLLGITQWELSEYTGQTKIPDTSYNETFNAIKRAKMALEFLS